MGGSQKSKSLTWASDVNLCQVRLFLSEESPSEVGMGTQDHLQAKLVQSGGIGSDDNLPPGFDGIQPANLWRVKLSQIPLMKWRCPPRFEINSEWQVVAGEESKEMEMQNQREMRVLEAIYPRQSAIPPDPVGLLDAGDLNADDRNTPLVPVTPIEDDDTTPDTSFSYPMTGSNHMISQPQHSFHGTSCSANIIPHANGISATAVDPDVIAAAQATLTLAMGNNSNSDKRSLIDHHLLIKILSDPKMVEQLVLSHSASSNAHDGTSSSVQNMLSSSFQSMPGVGVQSVTSSGTHASSSSSSVHNIPSSSLHSLPAIGVQKAATTGTQNMASTSTHVPNLSSKPDLAFDQINVGINRRDSPSAPITRPDLIPPATATATGPSYPQIRTGAIPNPWPSAPEANPAPSAYAGTPVTKDLSYYKSLIQQHGGDRRDVLPQVGHHNNQPMGANQEPSSFPKSRDSRPKIMKPCIYFNSPKGCRNGANCSYQHDTSSQRRISRIPEVQSAKRVKLDREISGTSSGN